MTVRSQPAALLVAGLAALVGYVDVLVFLKIAEHLLDAVHSRAGADGAGIATVASFAGSALALVIAFVAGVVAGSLFGHWARGYRRPAVLGLAAALLLVAALLVDEAAAGPVLLLMVIASGSMHGVLEDGVNPAFGVFALIGRFGGKLATAIAGGESEGWALDILLATGLCIGIVAGFMLSPHFGLAGVWLAAGVAALLALGAAVTNRAVGR